MIEPIKPSENESQPSLINWMNKPEKQRSAMPDRPSRLARNMVPVRNDLNREYANNLSKATMENPDELLEDPEEEIKTVGIEFLAQRRMIPIGKLINQGKPYFLKFPEITDTTYNVFTFVGPMGSAKTIVPETPVLTKEFGMLTIEELHDKLHEGSVIHVFSLIPDQPPRWSKVKDAWITTNEELHALKVMGGASITCSMNHKILVWDGGVKEKRLHELTTSDYVLFPKKIDIPEVAGNPGLEKLALFAGIFLADGCSDEKGFIITNWKLINQIRSILKDYCVPYSESFHNNCYDVRAASEKAREFFNGMGFSGHITSANKSVPAWIFQNKAYIRKFLQGYLECDGTFIVKKPGKDRKGNPKKTSGCQISVVSKTRKLAQAVVYALMAFGIKSTWSETYNRATNGKESAKPHKYYRICISDRNDLRTYLREVGVTSDYTRSRVECWNMDIEANSNYQLYLKDWLQQLRPKLKDLPINPATGKKGGMRIPEYRFDDYFDYETKKPQDNARFRRFLAYLDEHGLENEVDKIRWLVDNYHMCKVESIKPFRTGKAYDIEVEDQNFLGGEGCGFFIHNSTNVRSMIYYTNQFNPECINIIFDPMKMEFSKLAIKKDTIQKRMSLLHEVMFDPETAERIKIVVEPDTLKVFHIIPKFALNRENWDQEDMGYRSGFDKTTLAIMKKDGGFIFAEDASRMTEEQLFNCLNYREIRTEQTVHFYLRAAKRICDNKHGERNWFIQDLIDVLKENVRKFKDIAEADDIGDFDEASEDGGRLSTNELQLIEQLEKYKDIGFFVTNEDERKQYCVDWRKFIKMGRVLNISFLAFRKTDKVGEDLVRGQADLILERLIEISNEYYDAVRKTEAQLPINAREEYLLKHWKINLWFEEAEIFMPRDCPVQNIKKWPCIKRLDHLLSFGRKFGFKNFSFITQRVTKVNPLVFKESSHLFIGPIIGEERDQILSDFGVNKISFRMIDKTGIEKEVQVRDVVTTLSKDKHEWVFINKGQKQVAAIATFDSPCG
jgi:hypothetical protein